LQTKLISEPQLISFETVPCIADDGYWGSRVLNMTDNAAPQGLNLGSTQQSSAAVAAAAMPERKSVNADSFRRLSMLLKKSSPIPDLVPAAPASAPEFIAPTPPAAPQILAAPEPQPLPEPEQINQVDLSPVIAAEPEIVIATVAAVEIDIAPIVPVQSRPEPAIEVSPVFAERVEIAPVLDSLPSTGFIPATPAATQPQISIESSDFFSSLPSAPVTIAATEPQIEAAPVAPTLDLLPSAPISFTTTEPKIEAAPAAPTLDLLPAAPISFTATEPKIEAAPVASTLDLLPSIAIDVAPANAPTITVQETSPLDLLPSAQLPAVEEQKVEIEPAPAKVELPSNRPKPRDAFALPPSAMPQQSPKPAPIVIAQTPEQEQESAELARSLLDMMASGASSGLPQERALAADTLLRMVPRLPLKSMVMLAERLCMMESPPHLLVTKLICDQRIEVAGPLLEECSHITDEDLSLVIQEGEPAKRRMMARRRHVSRTISAQLVNTADPSVLLNLVRNQNAEISHESFVQLVQHASQQEDLLAPLCIRADLPVPFAFELFWHAPAQLRRYLLSRFLTDSETLTKILKIALVTNGDETPSTEFSNPEKLMEALQLADDGQLDEAAAILGAAAQINPATAARILADRQGEPLAALFKAVGITRAAANEILHGLKNSISGLIDPERDPDELQGLFDSLSFNKARILLTYWDWATLKTGPYAPLN
jgi:uncharacterized protein (DUF2336 family)